MRREAATTWVPALKRRAKFTSTLRAEPGAEALRIDAPLSAPIENEISALKGKRQGHLSPAATGLDDYVDNAVHR